MTTEREDNSVGLDFVIDGVMAFTDNLEFDEALRIADTFGPEEIKQQEIIRGIILRERALKLKPRHN